jgi:hypothetical protein
MFHINDDQKVLILAILVFFVAGYFDFSLLWRAIFAAATMLIGVFLTGSPTLGGLGMFKYPSIQ